MSFGFAFQSRRRAPVAPPLIDPATLGLSGYWEQRGDTNDYSQTDTDGAGPDTAGTFEDRSGNSRNWVQATSANRPSVGSAVDGKPRILLDSSGTPKRIDNANTLATFGTSAELAVSLLVRIPSIAAASWAVQGSPMLWSDVSGWFGICYGQDAGVNYVGVVGYDSGWRFARAPVTAGAWCEVNAHHASGKLQIAVNAAPSAAYEAACGNIGQTSYALRTGHSGIGTASSYELLSWAVRQTLSGGDFATITAWRKSLYPAAGLP